MNLKRYEKLNRYIMDGKIAYVMDCKNYLGGAGNHLLRHAMLSKEYGFKIIVVIPNYGDKENNSDVENVCIRNNLNYKFIEYKTEFDFAYIDGDEIENSMNVFIDFIKSENIKLIHSVQLNPAIEMASRMLNIPHVMSIYQIEKDSFNIKYPDMFPKFIHSDSYLYEEIWHNGLKAETICIRSYIPEKFRDYSISERKYINNKREFNCVISGSLCERKSQHKVVEVAGLFKGEGIKINIKILGYTDRESSYYKFCRSIEEEYGLKNQVIYKGFCENVELEMKDADFLVCVSNDESFPQVILEAMAMKIPVISTPVAGVPELIKNNETGYLAESFEVCSIKKAVHRYINDYNNAKKDLETIISNAYKVYKNECSRKTVSEKLFGFYYKAIFNKYKYNDKQKNLSMLLKKYNDFGMYEFINFLSHDLDIKSLSLVKNRKFGIVYKINYISRLYSGKQINYYIWGASTAGAITKSLIQNKLKNFSICGFVDKFKSGEFCGVKIYKPEEINFVRDKFIFIATGPGKNEVKQFLDSKGLRINENYISIFV